MIRYNTPLSIYNPLHIKFRPAVIPAFAANPGQRLPVIPAENISVHVLAADLAGDRLLRRRPGQVSMVRHGLGKLAFGVLFQVVPHLDLNWLKVVV